MKFNIICSYVDEYLIEFENGKIMAAMVSWVYFNKDKCLNWSLSN